MRKYIHPLLLKIIKQQRRHKLHILNSPPQVALNAIYVVNHSCKYDFPYAAEVIKHHTYVLVGKQHLYLIDKIAFFLNGVIYVDRKSKTDKAFVKNKIIKLMLNGENLCVFPEGTWNLTPSKPMLPLYWGVVDIARETKCPIIPLVLEYKEKDCYVKWGNLIYVTERDIKQNKIRELSDEMATLKWNIWEMFPRVLRKEIGETEWEKEKEQRLAEYPKLDYEYEKSIIRL